MLVENDTKADLPCLPNHIVQLAQPLRFKLVLCVHVPERLQVDADKIEPRLANLGEVPPLESTVARIGPIGIVAKNIHSTPKWLLRLRGGRTSTNI